MARQRKWIAGALDWPRGTLHAALKVPAGQTIPLATLERAARAPGVLGKRARAALNVRGLHRRNPDIPWLLLLAAGGLALGAWEWWSHHQGDGGPVAPPVPLGPPDDGVIHTGASPVGPITMGVNDERTLAGQAAQRAAQEQYATNQVQILDVEEQTERGPWLEEPPYAGATSGWTTVLTGYLVTLRVWQPLMVPQVIGYTGPTEHILDVIYHVSADQSVTSLVHEYATGAL